MDADRRRLLQILYRRSFRYREDPPFLLASGRKSPYYIDCKPTTMNAEAGLLIGRIIYDMVKGLNIRALGGLTLGADPIAYATSVVSAQMGNPISCFSVRKRQKDHGIPNPIDGDINKGDRVVVVEDVVTTGESTIRAIEAARSYPLKVVKVIALVDRIEGGRESIQRYVADFESVFTRDDLMEIFKKKEGINT